MGKYSVNDISNMTSGVELKVKSPVVTMTYVQVGDIDGVNYVSGSEGKVKDIKEYEDLAKTILITTTTMKYGDSAYPTSTTEIKVI